MKKTDMTISIGFHSDKCVSSRQRANDLVSTKIWPFKAMGLILLAVCVGGIAQANPTVAPLNSVDQIVGLRQDNGNALGYYPNANSNLVGNTGNYGALERYGANLVLGYTLPTLPAGTTVDSADFKFEITENRDQGNSDPSVQVHLLDVVDPDSSGTAYFYNGPADANAATVLIDSTYIEVGMDTTAYADDLHDQTYVISGDALNRLKSYYGGDNVPERTEVFFRFSLDIAVLDTFYLDRYRIDLASDESSLEITSAVSTGNSAPEWTSDPIAGSDATEDNAYSGSLTGAASDPNGDALTFAKVGGPAWLVVASNGSLSGTPGAGDVGANSFTVSVSDNTAPAVEATLNIEVLTNGSWRSSLYPSTWSPPDGNDSFYTDKIIQDFSYAGYKRGEELVPNITGPIFDVTDPAYGADPTGATDSTVAIQSAIDAAELAGGGVVYLPAGDYKISPQGGNAYCLLIDSSDIVLRGAGADSTFLTNTETNMRSKDMIRVNSPSVTTEVSVNITADLNGPTRRLPVATAASFAVGDVVRLQWKFTDAWIAEHNQQSFWSESGGAPVDAQYLREVTAVNEAEGWIEVDVPTRYTMKVRDNARVSVVNGLLENVGVESLAIGNVQHPGTGFGENDYNTPGTTAYDVHASYMLKVLNVRDSWITGVESFQPAGNTSTCHMLSNGILITSSCRVTVSDCVMSRSQYGGGGGNGYMYRFQYANECLMKDSVADFSRHGIVISHAGTSGNVFFQCEDRETKRSTGSSGSYTTDGEGSDHHMHFSHSNLFDRCSVFNSYFTASHRSIWGTVAHALTSAHGVYWNTTGGGTRYNNIVETSQGRYGYVIGTSGSKFGASNPTTGNTAPADHLEGIGSGDSLYPSSLYLDQLSQRVSPAVTYVSNGADGGTVPVDASSPYTNGATVTVLGTGDMTRSGFSFDGWNTAADGSGTAYAENDTFTIDSHVTLYAQWTGASYTLTFNANNGDAPSPTSKTVTNGESYGALATATRTGYNLKGWFTAPAGGSEVNSSDIVDTLSDLTFYAQWSQPPAVDAGSDQTASLSGAVAWTPAELSTEAWFDAADTATITHSGGAVSQWDDKSGNDKHLGQPAGANQPLTGAVTVNGENALQFSSDFLFNASGTNADIKSVVIVSKNNAEITSASGAAGMLSIYDTLISAGDGLGSTTGALTNEIISIFDEDEPAVYVDRQGVSSSTLSSISAGTHMYSYVRSTDWFIGLDGSGDLRDLTSGTRHDLLFSNGFGVGGMLRDASAPGNYFDGAICEVLLLSTTLSEGDRQKLEGYLAHKWGTEGSLPLSHPYRAAAPTMAAAIVNLDGTVSDPEDDALTTTWSVVSGPALVEFGDSSLVDTTATFTANGSYTLRLTANDASGTTSDDIVVQIGDVPTVTAWPTAADITQGAALSSATLSGGSASVAGSFSYDAPSTIPSAGIYSAAVTFTPTDTSNYLNVSGSVDVTVIAPTEPFDSWAATGSGVTPGGDTNNDGIADGLGWLLGASSPAESATDLVPDATVNSDGLVLNFQMLNTASRGSATLGLQYSKDLGVTDSWSNHTVTIPESSGTVDGVVFVITPIEGTDLNQVQATVPESAAGGGSSLFSRLIGEIPSP